MENVGDIDDVVPDSDRRKRKDVNDNTIIKGDKNHKIAFRD